MEVGLEVKFPYTKAFCSVCQYQGFVYDKADYDLAVDFTNCFCGEFIIVTRIFNLATLLLICSSDDASDCHFFHDYFQT
jgi:hypothetical protein